MKSQLLSAHPHAEGKSGEVFGSPQNISVARPAYKSPEVLRAQVIWKNIIYTPFKAETFSVSS